MIADSLSRAAPVEGECERGTTFLARLHHLLCGWITGHYYMPRTDGPWKGDECVCGHRRTGWTIDARRPRVRFR